MPDELQPYLCRQCRSPLGVTDATVLYLGAVRLDRTTRLTCSCCGCAQRWAPADDKTDKRFTKPAHDGTISVT